jgi:hypothetical protein
MTVALAAHGGQRNGWNVSIGAAPVRQSTSGGAALAHFTHAWRLDEAMSQKSSAAHERRRSRDYHFGSRLADMPRAPACRSSMPRAAGLE